MAPPSLPTGSNAAGKVRVMSTGRCEGDLGLQQLKNFYKVFPSVRFH